MGTNGVASHATTISSKLRTHSSQSYFNKLATIPNLKEDWPNFHIELVSHLNLEIGVLFPVANKGRH